MEQESGSNSNIGRICAVSGTKLLKKRPTQGYGCDCQLYYGERMNCKAKIETMESDASAMRVDCVFTLRGYRYW